MNGARIPLTDIKDSDRIVDIKQKIQIEHGYPIAQQVLIFKGMKLLDEKRLRDFDIKDRCIIHLLFNRVIRNDMDISEDEDENEDDAEDNESEIENEEQDDRDDSDNESKSESKTDEASQNGGSTKNQTGVGVAAVAATGTGVAGIGAGIGIGIATGVAAASGSTVPVTPARPNVSKVTPSPSKVTPSNSTSNVKPNVNTNVKPNANKTQSKTGSKNRTASSSSSSSSHSNSNTRPNGTNGTNGTNTTNRNSNSNTNKRNPNTNGNSNGKSSAKNTNNRDQGKGKHRNKTSKGKAKAKNKIVAAKKPHLFSPSSMRQIVVINKLFYIGSGLPNIGNTCFMNSMLQCLSYTSALQNYLLTQSHMQRCRDVPKSNYFCFMCELHRLLPNIAFYNSQGNRHSNTRTSINQSLYNIFNRFPLLSNNLTKNMQHDCHEFWLLLIKKLQDNVIISHFYKQQQEKLRQRGNNGKNQIVIDVSLAETTIIYKIFGGYLQSCIECLECNYQSKTFDNILDLSLEIINFNNIISILQQYTIIEKLNGSNKYFCIKCNKKCNAIKQLTINNAPHILILHLKRFKYGGLKKNDKFIKFNYNLDLTPFMSYYKQIRHSRELYNKYKVTYSLYAIIVHSGQSVNHGHYYAFVKINTNKWYCMNDSSVKSVSLNYVLSQNAYMLFYQRNEMKNFN